MTDWQEVFAPVRDELDIWLQAGLYTQLWLRDDDATHPTPALDRLVSITGLNRVPLLLCVIPEPTTRDLSDWLAGHDHVRVAVHGIGHRNHAPAGEKSQELGPHRPIQIVCDELARARAKLLDLYGDRLSCILVPPWNRVSTDVVTCLPKLGFTGISMFGPVQDPDGVARLEQLNTDLDIIDWKGSRGGREPVWLARELAKLLQLSREGGKTPIGVLTHHLVHDEPAWAFLEELFKLTAPHPAVRWRKADALIKTIQMA